MDRPETLDEWYESLSPLKVDLLGDFAGKELFAIHGEALLLHCITQARVDFDGGFQLLHAVHAVESFLHQLRERGCNFHVVWFDDHVSLASPELPAHLSKKWALTRAVLVRHLQQTCVVETAPSTDEFSFEFPGLDHSTFHAYLEENPIHFFLCLDPKAFTDCGADWDRSYLGIAHWFGAKGYNLAFINDVDFVSSTVQCSVVSPSPLWKAIAFVVPGTSSAEEGASRASQDAFLEDVASGDWSPWEDKKELTSREATALSVLCTMATAHEKDAQAFCGWAAAYIIHLALLRRLPLALRSLDEAKLENEEVANGLLSEFSGACTDVLRLVPNKFQWDSFDLLDGRLLRLVAAKQTHLPSSLINEAQGFSDKIKQATGVDIQPSFSPLSAAGPHAVSAPSADGVTAGIPGYNVLSFSQPILNSYLPEIKASPTSTSQKQIMPKIYKELTYWHTARVSTKVKRPPRPLTHREARSNQKWLNTFMKYSASLTNASGKTIDPETVIVYEHQTQPTMKVATAHSKAAKLSSESAQSAKKGKNKKAAAMSGKEKAMQAAEAIRKGKVEVKSNSALSSWEEQCKRLEREPNLVARYRDTMRYLNGLKSDARLAVGSDVSVYSCNVLAIMLMDASRSDSEKSRISALMWSMVVSLSKQEISPSSGKFYKALVKSLGFPPEIANIGSDSLARPLPYKTLLDKEVKLPSLQLATIDFQLQHCGPFLERSFDPAPDSRVSFVPDAWQRRVLDAIDVDKSLFVVAPTSAGKTFISFYAMKKVLKTSDDGILVYVAPTKALVNQIAAEIQARFSKSYKQNGTVWAIHTRDYRMNDPGRCQVLVTVPHILQIMLMAPSNAEQPNSWARRVKRIIFDEVHCIGQADDGVIWEQLLLLAPCPLIALSATVGNPLEFEAWLRSSETAKGTELETIIHSTRYSDLRKFLWKPREKFVFDGVEPVEKLPIPGLDDGSETASHFSYIHPVATLVNRNRGTLQDLNLEPRDCATLWASMAKHQNKDFPLSPSLDPTKALPQPEARPDASSNGTGRQIVRKTDVAQYEAKLKDVLQTWMMDRNSPFDAVQKDLRSQVVVSEFLPEDLQKHTLSLLKDLNTQGALPAILFNYDRVSCEDILLGLVAELSQAEESWKAASPEWNRRVAKLEMWKKDKDKMKALIEKTEKAKAKGKRQNDDNADDGGPEDDPSTWASFDPQAPLSKFSFADETKFSASELEETIRSLRWKQIDPRIIDGLRRGIGVHHAGMNNKYRQVVEMLFRKGFLTVVVATGTLALGLNMPCKTVVFYGDSIFLTALNYHQAAGRAGRRGFDLLGNVVFAGMTQERVHEIMSSRLPDIRGHFPLSTTLVLRTIGLLHHTKNCDYSVRAVKALLSQTRLYLGGPADEIAIKHHLRFSIEYLRRQHLLDGAGAPINFAGLAGHLYFTENAVFGFHSLLKEGYFHSLCAEYKDSPTETLHKLVLVLSHIFCRIPTRSVTPAWEELIRKSPSLVFLPPLPEEPLRILRQHNQDTLGMFKGYTGTFVDQHLSEKPDRVLPFTKIGVGAGGDVVCDPNIQQILGNNQRVPTKLRSPFSALSGFGDDSFESVRDLCTTVRGGVFLEESAIPYIPLHPDNTGGKPWNAYIYDFYKHGDMEAVIRDNQIKRGDVWFHLKDFSLVMATIVASLKNFVDLTAGDDADLAMMDVQDAQDADQDRKEIAEETEGDKLQENETGPGSSNADGQSVATGPALATRKAPVPDSWDDGSDDESPSDDGSETESAPPAWEGDDEHKLPLVLSMFEMVRDEFDEKFKAIWA